MEYKKIIDANRPLRIVQWEFQGMPITFRLGKTVAEIIEIKVDEYFAKANGYKSVEDMAENTIGQAKFKELFGGVPEWIRVSPNGEFTFVGINPILYN